MFTKILVPLDRSTLAEQAIGRAAALARQCQAELDLVLVHDPLLPGGPTHAEHVELGIDADRRYLEAIASELIERCVDSRHVRGVAGIAGGGHHETRARGAHRSHRDDVAWSHRSESRVVGQRCRWCDAALGSARAHAAPDCRAARSTARQDAFNHVLVPLDGSANAAEVLPTALGLAQANRAQLSLLRVVPPIPAIVALDPAMPAAFGPIIPDQPATSELGTRRARAPRRDGRSPS